MLDGVNDRGAVYKGDPQKIYKLLACRGFLICEPNA